MVECKLERKTIVRETDLIKSTSLGATVLLS